MVSTIFFFYRFKDFDGNLKQVLVVKDQPVNAAAKQKKKKNNDNNVNEAFKMQMNLIIRC